MIWLTAAQVLSMHREMARLTGGQEGLRDAGLLEAALSAPFQSFGGAALYPTLWDKAARLGAGLTRNHPFLDGNKRMGAHAMLVFLAQNGVEVAFAPGELARMFWALADGRAGEAELAAWLRARGRGPGEGV